ncbi:MAG: chemotaxis protein CheA [SAR324 cluster bacterium]|nr:chemotaxis protein CheA [SAR324 cluster bacterium]
MTFNEDQQLIIDFVTESQETIETVEPALIHMEGISDAHELQDIINLIFRPFHSLKGSAGFLGFHNIEKLTHRTETLLQEVRVNPDKWQYGFSEILVKSCDLVNNLLNHVESTGNDRAFEPEISQHLDALDIMIELSQKGEITQPVKHEEWKPTLSIQEVLSQGGSLLESLMSKYLPLFESENIVEEATLILYELKRYATLKMEPASEPHVASENLYVELDPLSLFDLPPQDSLPPAKSTASPDIKPDPKKADVQSPTEITKPATLSTGSVQNPERIQLFISDILEHLETIEGVFLVLDKLGEDVDKGEFLNSAKRSFHTIKGNAGFLGMAHVERLSHKAESVLEMLQDGTLSINSDVMNPVLETIDVLRDGSGAIASGQEIDTNKFEQCMNLLDKLIPANKKAKEIPSVQIPASPTAVSVTTPASSQNASKPVPQPQIPATPAIEKAKSATSTPAAKTDVPAGTPQLSDIRVSLDKLDHLIDLVGELVISDSMMAQRLDKDYIDTQELKSVSGQMHRNMRELQEIAMSLRMIPVASVFRKMIRVVHDASKKLNKQVELVLKGEETEVDKSLIEQVSDPLLHLIRNAIDHGIEDKEGRKTAKKPDKGIIVLEARYVGNELWITIQDDGKGLNREKILAKAREQNLIGPDANLPDHELWKMILEPGFSTNTEVTAFSGRGVGMDVVKKNIEKLRGSIHIATQQGKGTLFTLKVPLTLSIIDGLLVNVGEVSYVLPTISIKESLQPKAANIFLTPDGSEMLRIRNRLLPVIRLHRLYQIETGIQDLTGGMLLVIESSERAFCLFVDAIVGQQQIVVKTLPPSMTEIPYLAGCTILGDGQVGLILDMSSMGSHSSN